MMLLWRRGGGVVVNLNRTPEYTEEVKGKGAWRPKKHLFWGLGPYTRTGAATDEG